MSIEHHRGVALSVTEQRLSGQVGEGLVAGAKFILQKYPQILGQVSRARPIMTTKLRVVKTGVEHVPYRAPDTDNGETHPNQDIGEAISRATSFAWAKSPDAATFTTQAVLHQLPVKDSTIERKGLEGAQSFLTPQRTEDLVLQPERHLIVDGSQSMSGGADLLALVIETAYLLDCASGGNPLTVRFLPRTSGTEEVTRMETSVDLEATAAKVINDYRTEGPTRITQAIMGALSDFYNQGKSRNRGGEIVLVTDGEMTATDDETSLRQVVSLAGQQGVKIKIVYLQDPNIQPAGPQLLKNAGCQVETISLDVIKQLPAQTQRLLLKRPEIQFQIEEVLTIKDILEKTMNVITYLCAASALYLTAGGGGLFISKGIDATKAGINIWPWKESLSSGDLDVLTYLTMGLQLLSLLLLFRKNISKYILEDIPVPELIQKLGDVRLHQEKQELGLLREVEAGTVIFREGRRVEVQKGEEWEAKGSFYHGV